MRKIIRKLYASLACRIYSVGRAEYLKRHEHLIRKNLLVGKGSVLYKSAGVINLSKDSSNIVIGMNSHIYGLLIAYSYAGKIQIGDNCSLGDFSRIVSGKSITIGNRVMIAHNVNILDNNSHPIDAKLRHEDFMFSYSEGMKYYDLDAKEIKIEDDVWIGFNSIILKGVTIGRGAIIGAGSVVTKDVEPWTVNVGNPLRCVQKLEPINF